MENIVNLITKLKFDESLIKFCKVILLSPLDIARLKVEDDWQLELKINIEFDLAYDKLYYGVWTEVPEEFRRMFQILSFLKAYCTVKNQKDNDLKTFLKALHVLDVGIIIGSGLEESNLLIEFAELLHDYLGKTLKSTVVSLLLTFFKFS